MFVFRLFLASLAFSTVLAEVLRDSEKDTASSNTVNGMTIKVPTGDDHTEISVPTGSNLVIKSSADRTEISVTTGHDKGPGEPLHGDSDVKEQQLESFKQAEHNAALKLTDGLAEPEPININDINDSNDEVVPSMKPQSSIEVAFDGAKVARSSPVSGKSVEQPATETESTTSRLLVNPSGEIYNGNSVEAPATHLHHRHEQRAGTNARVHMAGGVLRQEKETPVAEVVVSTTAASPVLRTEKSLDAVTVADGMETSSDASPSEPRESEATFKEIRLSSVEQPVTRNHRMPTSPPIVKTGGITTTAAALHAASDVEEPETLGWEHGLIPGILRYLEVKEDSVIKVSIAVFLVIVLVVFACRYVLAARPPEASMLSGLSTIDFVEAHDAGVRAMLNKLKDTRKKGYDMEHPNPSYPGGVETPTPTVLAPGQSS